MRSRVPSCPSASAFVLVVLLSGCSDVYSLVEPKNAGETVMTPDEAKHDLWDRLDAAQEALGGTWEKSESALASECEGGFYYDSVRRRVELSPDPDVPTAVLAAFWDTEEYSVTSGSFSPDHRYLTAIARNGTGLFFSISDTTRGKVELSGDGPCIPGDFGEVSDEDLRKVRERRGENPELPAP